MINYRYESGCTKNALVNAKKNIPRLQNITTIEGYRFASRRSYKDEGERVYWRNSHERLRVKASNGQALFDGVCWGYHGEGPRGLVEMLVLCGVSESIAKIVAFTAPRNNGKGVDWRITIGPNGEFVSMEFFDLTLKIAA